MTIYLDTAFNLDKKSSRTWSHLATDGNADELHEFAQSIGLRREWFQDDVRHPHYDVCSPRIRRLAIQRGAVLVSFRELFRKCFGDNRNEIISC